MYLLVSDTSVALSSVSVVVRTLCNVM